MFKIKKAAAFLKAAAILSIAALTGCQATIENLLTAPKLTQEQSEIYQALINSSGSSIKLKYPRGGEYRSAFVLQDIDSDGTQEALVFYESQSVQSGESALRLKVLDNFNGSWEAVYDLACVGSEVDSISFASLGDDSTTEILVCYSMLNQSEKTLSVLNYSNGLISELYSGSYSCMEVIDLNGDGQQELVSVVPDKATQTAMAVMFTKREGTFRKLSEVQLSGIAAEYVSVSKGMLDGDVTALFLDYGRGAGQYSSQGNIISRFTNDYMTDIRSIDIDGDGAMEIPSMTPLPGYETLMRSEQLCAVEWYTVENNRYSRKYYSYYSSKYNFVLLFPSRWQGVVSAVLNTQDNEIVFISYDPEKKFTVDKTTELMRIRTIAKDDTEALVNTKDYRMIGESDESIICIKETTGYLTGMRGRRRYPRLRCDKSCKIGLRRGGRFLRRGRGEGLHRAERKF